MQLSLKAFYLVILISITTSFSANSPINSSATLHKQKIVGLLPVRNESHIIAQGLKTLSLYCDAIVVLDDASTDNTVEIIESLIAECHIEKIIKKKEWFRDEPGDRNALLQTGREIGGTHFIVLDADEMFTANCLGNDFLRNKILSLQPGDVLLLNLIQLWRSVDKYRFDDSIWTDHYGQFIFCDDGICSYSSDFIHTGRTPNNLQGNDIILAGDYGVMYFQFVNWRNLLTKQAWYRCLEHIHNPQKSISAINSLYAPSKNEYNLKCKPVPSYWFTNYPFFNKEVYNKPEQWREKQVLEWFKEHGQHFFSNLDIWDIDWGASLSTSQAAHNSVPLYFCTGANSDYFPHLLNLIGSIHNVNFNELGHIAIFNLGLTDEQINQLNEIEKLTVHQVEKTHPDILTFFYLPNGYRTLGWYAWKPVAIKQALDMFPYVLWIDAGSTVLKSLSNLFKHIKQNDYFLGTIGDEMSNDQFMHPVEWGTTQYIINKFDLTSPEKKWMLSQESLMGNIIGISRVSIHDFIIPLYELTKDLRNFQDDGTTPQGFGTARHDQTLLSILGYTKNLNILKQDHTQNTPMYLTVNNNQIPFYITWNPHYVNEKTSIYSSRGDLTNINHYQSCIHYKEKH